MNTGRRLPLLTEVLELPSDADAAQEAQEAQEAKEARVVGSLAALHPGAGAPASTVADPPLSDHPAVSTEMARAVLELELEQALREVLEPRLAVLLRETAAELAQRLQPRMHEWLDERGAGD